MSAAIYSFINSITNSITSRYDIKAQISSAGLWKIYLGLRKTTGKHVAIFVSMQPAVDPVAGFNHAHAPTPDLRKAILGYWIST